MVGDIEINPGPELRYNPGKQYRNIRKHEQQKWIRKCYMRRKEEKSRPTENAEPQTDDSQNIRFRKSIKLATWNCRTATTIHHITPISKDIEERGIFAIALQETRWEEVIIKRRMGITYGLVVWWRSNQKTCKIEDGRYWHRNAP